jgi:REP element-mobilizing transposase RayT
MRALSSSHQRLASDALALQFTVPLALENGCRAGAPPAKLPRWATPHGFPFGCVGNNQLSISLQSALNTANRCWANEAAFNAFKNAAARLREWRVLAAILMPDLLHTVVAPRERTALLGNFSGALKRWMRQELNAAWQWQPGCFDRLLRSGESLHEKWLYIQENPVRAGLVRDWRDWPYRFEFNEEQ